MTYRTRKARAKARLARQIQRAYADYTDVELQFVFDHIGDGAERRVKKTGHLKLFWLKQSDLILDELIRRRVAREAQTFTATGLAYDQTTRDWTQLTTYVARTREEAVNWVGFNRNWFKDLRIDGVLA